MMVSCASARSARLPRLTATRSFAQARRGVTINESAVSAIPTTLSPARSPVRSRRPDSATMYTARAKSRTPA
jgi:hypothetical protein